VAALLDAQALIAFAVGEGPGRRVRHILRTRDCATTAINLAEVVQKLLRDGAEEERVRESLEPLGLVIIAVDASLAWRAGNLRARHYGRRTSRVSLADCCLVAASSSADTVVSGDRGVTTMAQAEGLKVVEL
jgi:PIN domain nuclease of toxin-antitoxin system